jgi:hypothetical protein
MTLRERTAQVAEKCQIKHDYYDNNAEGAQKSKYLWSPDLAPVEPARRTWGWYNFMNLWISGRYTYRAVFYNVDSLGHDFVLVLLTGISHSLVQCQYVAACRELRRRRSRLVARLALYLGRIYPDGCFRLTRRPNGGNVPHFVSRGDSLFFRHLWVDLASAKSYCPGHYLVLRPGLDWRTVSLSLS